MTGKADRKCCVPACGKTRSEDVTLHVFPNPDKEPDRFRTWLYAIEGDILTLDNLKIFKHRKVCHAHFEQRFYTSSKRLAANAIPTLHLKGKDAILHVFPNPDKDPDRFRTWLYAVGGDILALDNSKIFKYRKVCHDHFEQQFYTSSNRLASNTIPTLHLKGTLEKINKINEDHCYNNGKLHVDHSYSLQDRPSYLTDVELVAELSDYIEKRHAGQPNKDIEGQENSNATSNDIVENEEQSQIISKRPVQACRKNSADESNSHSFSTEYDFEKHAGSQINSKRRNNANRNNSNSNSLERNSAAERYTYSFNITSDNVIDVIRTDSNITAPVDITAPEDTTVPEDVNDPEAQTCITDDKEYRFDGDYFDDGLPTIEEPEPEVPEAVFSWQNELNLFPLDDVVHLEDDVPELEDAAAARAPRPALAAAAALYDPGAPEEALDAEYQCNECQKEITGFRYTCVQCADWDLCGACEARGEHMAHYLLRIPSPRPYNEIQTVLAAIRQQLLSENLFLRPEFTDSDWPTEVKEEIPGEDSGGEHSQSEDSSDDSSGPPRRKRRLTDELLHFSPEHEVFSPELSAANLPASVPVASTEIPQDLITTIMTSRNPSELRTYGSFKSLTREKSLGGNSLLKPIQTEIVPEDPLRTDAIEPLASNSVIGVADNLTEQQTTETPPTQRCDDLPTIIIEDDAVQDSVLPPIQQPTLPVNILRTKAVNMISHDLPDSSKPAGSVQNSVLQKIQQPTHPVNILRRKAVKAIPHDLPGSCRPAGSVQNPVVHPIQQPTLPVNVQRTKAVKIFSHDLPVNARPVSSHHITRAQFFDKGFDDNLPAIILEDDEDDQPTDRVPQKTLLPPNDPVTKELAHNSPSRMDVDSSPTVERVTRSKRKFEKVTVHDSPVRKSVTNIQKNESSLHTLGGAIQTIGGAFQTLDQLIQEVDIVDITEEVPDTSRLTEAPETVVLRVPPGSDTAALLQALQSKAIVLLEPLQNVIQRVTPPRRKT